MDGAHLRKKYRVPDESKTGAGETIQVHTGLHEAMELPIRRYFLPEPQLVVQIVALQIKVLHQLLEGVEGDGRACCLELGASVARQKRSCDKQ